MSYHKVVGISHKDNTGKDGKLYHNHYIHCTYESDKVDGVGVELLSYAGDFDDNIKIGSLVKPNYNRWGKVDYVSCMDKK